MPPLPEDADRGTSAAAAALYAELCAQTQRRARLPAVWEAFVRAVPSHAADPDKRERLAQLLVELESTGQIRLPSAASWERRPTPPLPCFVTLVRDSTRRQRRAPLGHPWHPALAWAATTPLAPAQIAFLERVNRFLADRGLGRPLVAIRERSIELCGDEKRLEKLSATALFGPGRLSLDLLRVVTVAEPFAHTLLGSAPLLLVVENATTYRSLTRTLPSGGPVGVIGFGGGWQFVSGVAAAADLEPSVERILYFGDLDAQGLRIPIEAAKAARAAGLPPVEPAGGLYSLLLRVGQPQPLPSGDRGPSPEEAVRLAAWLPTELRSTAVEVISRRCRLAQEWVGYELLMQELHDRGNGYGLVAP